ncbi:hypothetical protein [Vibrio tapetis]|uniref:Uncharacterized protein n=1 Tax=Vibrio tapetis subsp. tapetis TaxID=1671868 RepID=A0A2N8ZBQ0_9VIBR|nr:hypothetical protein [Vibrio tapetis]CAK3577518.1 conserved hypothetical protein [Vibrio crassostreae]SON49318.1 protein of unknown function [Vibrio tapetis subsp. tapetis]
MVLDKFDIKQIGWNGSFQSVLDLFSELINYQLAPNQHKKPEQCLEFEALLESSSTLSKWQESKANNVKNPVFKLFQKKYRTFNRNDFKALGTEIQENGLFLSKGQILFRGVCSENSNDNWYLPVSTTLSPYIAIYHALKNGYIKPIKIYAIEIKTDSTVKAVVAPFGGNAEFGHEYEVLVDLKSRPKISEEIKKGFITFQLLCC